ncbi:uncharacterized protein N7506_005603 [Penicillium brevicompactum]|uniref:uncharacterized protein n=1 Tax=Penicillium brevicompactum TaxID=5074 RepID=UPI002541F909|nr:uncharacterized protein N7506_005603 [Penicillium brevicompactum]KAJ5335667.1 hypothetical protein N7506_005603 [Penicillium brevicompactum]
MRSLGRRVLAKGQRDTPEHPVKKAFPSGIKQLCGPVDGTVDIVFVHGLNEDRDATWTARDATDPWPKTLHPLIFPTICILTFGYDAYGDHGRDVMLQELIANHARSLLESLSSYRVDQTDERPIIFVCSGFGGLVCDMALNSSRHHPERYFNNVFRSTRGVIFLDTPNHEVGRASWAEAMFLSTSLIEQTNSEHDNNLRRDFEVISDIQDRFFNLVNEHSSEIQPQVEVLYLYEESPNLVATKPSAITADHTPDHTLIEIHGHVDMTKFTNVEDPGFVAICVANQYGESSRQYNLIGGGSQKIVEGQYFVARGHQHFDSPWSMPSKDTPDQQPPPYK